MPQSTGKSKNWMINPRVAPPDTSVRLDNSAAKLENRYLNARLKTNIDELDTRKMRKNADQKHVLKTAKKDAQAVIAQAKVLEHWKTFTADGNADNAQKVTSPDSSSDDDDFDDFSSRTASSRPSNADRVRPATTAVSFRLPSRSATTGSSINGRAKSGNRSTRPRTVGPGSSAATDGQKSYQHLKDMVENDSRRRLQGTDARMKVMLAMEEKRREDESRLQLRLQRFYTDLDQFIKRTKYPTEFRASNKSEMNSHFMLQFGSLGNDNDK